MIFRLFRFYGEEYDRPRTNQQQEPQTRIQPNTGVADMGTRADFYVGRGENAEWIGSIAWDGYPDGVGKKVFKAKTERAFRNRVADFFADREDVTLPENGWPWPWEDSRTTDYAYAFDGGKVWASCFGHAWFDPTIERIEDDYAEVESEQKEVFPKMDKSQYAVPGSKRSGLIVFTAPSPDE